MAGGPLHQTARGLLLQVKATPGARHDNIGKLVPLPDGSLALQVKVTAIAEGGKANAAILALIAKSAGVAKSSFTQVAGETDRHKVFRVDRNAEAIALWAAAIASVRA